MVASSVSLPDTPPLSPSSASLLELARSGNGDALSRWLNSLLADKGMYVKAVFAKQKPLTLQLYFLYPASREALIGLQETIVRMLSYRLWTLNSPLIWQVRVLAWQRGNRTLLWQQSLRIKTPANLPQRLRFAKHRRVQMQHRRRWQIALVGGMTTTGLFAASVLAHFRNSSGDTADAASIDGSSMPSLVQPVTPLLAPMMRPPDEPPRPHYSSADVPAAFRGQVVYDVTPANGEKVIALTFDDGPWIETTEDVLTILERFEVPATFFVTGRQVEQFPHLAQRIVMSGHAIANHSWTHPMENMDSETAIRELEGTNRLIEQATGVRPALFRPPGGNLNTRLVDYAKRAQLAVMMWSSDSEDYYVSAPLIVDNVLQSVRPGGIVLFHDGGGDQQATVDALPQLLATLSRLGYRFVTVPELLHLAQPGAPSSTGMPLGQE